MIVKSPFNGTVPKIHPSAFIAQGAVIIGDVEIGANVNIWFFSTLRGDWGKIIVGDNSCLQENVVLHSSPGTVCRIGKNVTVGHKAMVHGPCSIGDSSLIGINATVLYGAKVGKGCVLAGGSVLNGEADECCLYAGVPAIKKKIYPNKIMGEWGYNLYVKNSQKFKEAGYCQDIPKEFLIKM
ncbi:MAG: gamma carbonic anhydrase family protein [Promethearchaeota archaeon]